MKHWTAASFSPEMVDPLSARPRPGTFILDRWEVLQLVKDTARHTGIGEREIAVLAAHLSVLIPGPVRADQLLISYAQISGMLDRANCMDERRFRRGEARLEELGFVTRHLSGNCRRYPVRNASGLVVEAYGIDLRPVFLRYDELLMLRNAAAEERCRLAAQRSRLSAALTAGKRAMLSQLGTLPADFSLLAQEVRNLLRRPSAGPNELHDAESRLAAYLARDNENNGDGDSFELAQPDRTTADAGQNDRHSEAKRKEINISEPARSHHDHQKNSYDEVWDDYTEIASYYPSPPETQSQAERIIFEFSGFVGIQQRTIHRLYSENGAEKLLYALNSMASRAAQIRNADGYLTAMLARVEPTYDRGHKLRQTPTI